MIVGDFNTSLVRKTGTMPQRVESLKARLLDQFSLKLCSSDLAYTFVDSQGRNSTVDHVLTSKGLSDSLVSCEVIDNTLHSETVAEPTHKD